MQAQHVLVMKVGLAVAVLQARMMMLLAQQKVSRSEVWAPAAAQALKGWVWS
jgi:hypothetical protein